MNELKPVARVIPDHAHGEGVTTIAQTVEYELPVSARLYIIPDTHRVVSVELLEGIVTTLMTNGYFCGDIRAIIDKSTG